MDIIMIISAVISFITLICFFVLCFNVANIKKLLQEDDNWLVKQKFKRAKAFGDYDEARNHFKQIIWNAVVDINSKNDSVNDRIEKYVKLEEANKAVLLEFDLIFLDKEMLSKF